MVEKMWPSSGDFSAASADLLQARGFEFGLLGIARVGQAIHVDQ
jgi:hypothetical protein